MNRGDVIEIRGESLAYGSGAAVGHAPDGRVVFVPLLAPGDRAKVRIGEVKASFARGSLVELLAPGPVRVRAPCAVFGACGGCQWQHVALAAQREAKEAVVRRLLEPLGVADRVSPIRVAGDGYAYRNRLALPVRSGRDGLRAGFFRADSHDLVDVATCLVQSRPLWEVARLSIAAAVAAGVSGYNERLDRGCLRHLVVRASAAGEFGVVFVTATREFPQGEAIARELMRQGSMGQGNGIVGVAHNANPGHTNAVMGRETTALAGRGWLNERAGNLSLRVSLTAFFQANPAVAGIMADLVREWGRETTGGILDLYAGVGVLGLAAAGGGRPAWIAGIEESAEAAADAGANALANAAAVPGVPTEWHAGAVEAVLPELAGRLGAPGCVIADPPRKGLSPEALAAVIALRSPLVIYISCDPATFARDLKAFLAAGYRLEEVVPLDMFPQTYHIELAARLTIPG